MSMAIKNSNDFVRNPFLGFNVNSFLIVKKSVSTQLPRTAAIIRTLAAVVFAAYAYMKALVSLPLLFYPITFVSLAFAGWTIYSQILRRDQLMEAIFQIIGGRDKFEELPLLIPESNDKNYFSELIKYIKKEDLNCPIYRSKTIDGRDIVIIVPTNSKENGPDSVPTKIIYVFVERIGPSELLEPYTPGLSPRNSGVLANVFLALGCDNRESTRTTQVKVKGKTLNILYLKIHPFLSPEIVKKIVDRSANGVNLNASFQSLRTLSNSRHLLLG